MEKEREGAVRAMWPAVTNPGLPLALCPIVNPEALLCPLKGKLGTGLRTLDRSGWCFLLQLVKSCVSACMCVQCLMCLLYVCELEDNL